MYVSKIQGSSLLWRRCGGQGTTFWSWFSFHLHVCSRDRHRPASSLSAVGTFDPRPSCQSRAQHILKRVMGVIFKSTLKVNFNKSPCYLLLGHKSTATLVFPWQTHTASLPRCTTAPHRLPRSEITGNRIPKEKPPHFTRRKERPAK